MSLLQPPSTRTDRTPTRAYELVRALQRENDQLRQALECRKLVEQAKGAASARLGVLPDEAFELIRGLARSQRRRIDDFAADVVENRGALDPGCEDWEV
jgi:AmiR/NasT family two-component response regulator